MTIPLLVLAIMTVVSGFIPFHDLVTADGKEMHTHFDWIMVGASVGIGLLGILIATIMYKKENKASLRFRAAFGIFYKWSYNKFYFDELYMFVTKKIIFERISAPSAWFDKHIVDGTMNGIGNSTVWISEKIKGLQSGRVQDYAMFFVSGVVVIAMLFWYYL
jgi:NADH-quinone oxidoreductase subunit L